MIWILWMRNERFRDVGWFGYIYVNEEVVELGCRRRFIIIKVRVYIIRIVCGGGMNILYRLFI